MTFGKRRSLLLAFTWVAAGLLLLGAALIGWLDRGTITWFEVPLGLVGLVVGWRLAPNRVEMDRHGLESITRSGAQRTLWASVESVDVQDTWASPALRVTRKGDGSQRRIAATAGLRTRQRTAMFDALVDLSRDHGFTLRRNGEAVRVMSEAEVASADPAVDGEVGDSDEADTGNIVEVHGAAEDGSSVLDSADDRDSADDQDATDGQNSDDHGMGEAQGTGDDRATLQAHDSPDDQDQALGEDQEPPEDRHLADGEGLADDQGSVDDQDEGGDDVDPVTSEVDDDEHGDATIDLAAVVSGADDDAVSDDANHGTGTAQLPGQEGDGADPDVDVADVDVDESSVETDTTPDEAP